MNAVIHTPNKISQIYMHGSKALDQFSSINQDGALLLYFFLYVEFRSFYNVAEDTNKKQHKIMYGDDSMHCLTNGMSLKACFCPREAELE